MMATHLDASLPVEKRVESLLSLMTLEEKIAQLILLPGWYAYKKEGDSVAITEQFKQVMAPNCIGSIYGLLRADPWTQVTLESGLDAAMGAETANLMQRYAIEHSRLGIPMLIGEEGPHGHMAIGATVFPSQLNMASTWNPALVERVSAAMAAETRLQGGHVLYGPMPDIARDVRWGRTEETFGEDPYLASRMAVAIVKGLQGHDLASDDSIIATVKSFAHCVPEGGHNAAPANIGSRELHEIYLEPYRAAIQEAGALGVMSAYNEIDGIPCTANEQLLTHILRDQWRFDGIVVSDMGAIYMLFFRHAVAASKEEAAYLALSAGVDQEMNGNMRADAFDITVMANYIRAGEMPESLIDRAVRRVLKMKFRLGLFEQPYTDPQKAAQVIRGEASRQLAHALARESIILLKNENSVLPLAKTISSIAVMGPNADSMYNQLGDYTAPQRREDIQTVLDGIRSRVSAETTVHYVKGCAIRDPALTDIQSAVEAAKQSAVAIVVVGGASTRDFTKEGRDPITGAAVVTNEASEMEAGEGFDRATLDLLGDQLALVQAVQATGTPTIVVFINGRPLTTPWIVEHVPAILECWYPGEAGGTAIADVIFGDYNPSGKLPLSMPKSVGQLPVYYNHKPSARKKYVEIDDQPQYPFGYGLSYTHFQLTDLKLSANEIRQDKHVYATVTLTNVGGRAGAEVVQLYIRDDVATVTRPVKELKAFQKITLEAGQSVTVKFEIIPLRDLSFRDGTGQQILEAGSFKIMVGTSSQDGLSATLSLL